MALSNNDQARIRQYLLGHLTDEEQEKIEERLMVEDDLFEELEISKSEIIEEYRAGELAKKDHEWFGTHYLGSSEGRQRLSFVAALDQLKGPTPEPQRLTSFERFKLLFVRRPWAVAAAAAAVALAAMVTNSLIPRAPVFVAVELTNSVISRSPTENRYHPISLKPDVEVVKLSLKLPESATPGTSYRVDLDDRGEVTPLKPTAHDANSVTVEIPAKQLPPAIYALTVYAIKADGTDQRVPGGYFFQTTK
jgi:hypothetical protein